jgi:hypothetical protein
MMKLQADTVSIPQAKAKGSSAIGPEALAFMKTNVCHDDRLREVTSSQHPSYFSVDLFDFKLSTAFRRLSSWTQGVSTYTILHHARTPQGKPFCLSR